MTSISIIIPVYNEALALPQTLPHLCSNPNLEIIVVDGGSTDDSLAIAQSYDVKAFLSPEPGRAAQMNAGAALATGEILLFLHADTQLPTGFETLVRRALQDEQVVAGAFELAIAGSAPGLRWVEWGVKWRSHWFALPYGDQAVFLRRETFEAIGGFPSLPIMEDFVFVRQLQRHGKITILPQPVLTSARRWQRLGILKTTLINQTMIMGYYAGVKPQRLADWYRRLR
ncbi:MAG: glycosyltransferase family 2 protein [Spirulina sp. SIO3F2]|nr:glycosyltransferase family 2 protein [Spirulina sp. SIO3F2]